ncbi:MAG: ral nucleoside transport system permease protein [Actinomycetota bacterium]|jgi:simple sugar transport system permease protein|nr:ral nucleoside transport system permease protein [Actinomycetota bacterium]
MTTVADKPTTSTSEAAAPRLSRKAPIAMGIFALLAILLLIVFNRAGLSHIEFTPNQKGAVQIPLLNVAGGPTEIVIAILLALMAIGSGVLNWFQLRTRLWYIAIFAILIVTGFLVWASAGLSGQLNVTDLLTGAVAISTALIFGALGGVITEKVGVVNVAIEGQLLMGAFVSAVTATVTHSVVAGIIAAAVAGVLVSFVLGVFAIKYAVNQVIIGVVLNLLVAGLTTFLYQDVLLNSISALNSPPSLPRLPIPGISLIPVLGPLLFNQNIIVYLMYVAVVAVTIGLYRTRWGLRLRAVGEHPQAADTVGINVGRTRFWNVALAGVIVGVGGASFTLGGVGAFGANMTNGAGYIALAAVIFGGWDPIRATLAALLFGFTENLQSVLGTLQSPVPNDFLLMLPYVVTILAVAGFVGRVRGPAASGRPYVKS